MNGIGVSEFFFLVILSILLLIVFHKSRIPRYFFLFLLVAISYSYIDLADYEGYLQMYNGPKGNLTGLEFLDSTDVGFRFLVYVGNYLDLEFEIFKAIIYFFCGILLINALVRINNRSANFVLSLYIVYPLILDVVQVRHFIAMTTFIYAMSHFLKKMRQNEIKPKIYLYFFPSVMFHASFIYLVFLVMLSSILLCYIEKRDFILKNLILLFLSYSVVAAFLFFLNTTDSPYFLTTTSASTILFYSVVYLLFYLMLMIIRSRAISHHYIVDNRVLSFIIIHTTLLIGTTLPMLFFHVEFFRFFRVELLLLVSLMFSMTLASKNILNRFYTVLIFKTYYFLSVIIFYVYYSENLIYPLLLMGNL